MCSRERVLDGIKTICDTRRDALSKGELYDALRVMIASFCMARSSFDAFMSKRENVEQLERIGVMRKADSSGGWRILQYFTVPVKRYGWREGKVVPTYSYA